MLVIEGHRSQIRDVAFSQDGTRIASCAGQGYAVSLWDASTGTRICYLTNQTYSYLHLISVTFVGDGHELIAGANSGFTTRWNVETEECSQMPGVPQKPGRGTKSQCKCSRDGRYVTRHLNHGWNPVKTRFDSWDWTQDRHCSTIQDVQFSVSGWAIHPETKRLAVSSASRGVVFLLDFFTGDPRGQLHHKSLNVLDFSPDGSHLASTANRDVVIWDLEQRDIILTLTGHTEKITDMKYSSDGRFILTGSKDGTVRLWDATTGGLRETYQWNIGPITGIDVARDGMRALAGGNRSMVVWDLDE